MRNVLIQVFHFLSNERSVDEVSQGRDINITVIPLSLEDFFNGGHDDVNKSKEIIMLK